MLIYIITSSGSHSWLVSHVQWFSAPPPLLTVTYLSQAAAHQRSYTARLHALLLSWYRPRKHKKNTNFSPHPRDFALKTTPGLPWSYPENLEQLSQPFQRYKWTNKQTDRQTYAQKEWMSRGLMSHSYTKRIIILGTVSLHYIPNTESRNTDFNNI